MLLMSIRYVRSILLIILSLLTWSVGAQIPFDMGHHHITPPDNMCQLRWGRKKAIAALGEPVNGVYYLIAQFKEIPSEEVQQRLREKGLTLQDYIINNTYFVSLRASELRKCVKEKALCSLLPIQWEWKVASSLLSDDVPDFARRGNLLGVSVLYQDECSTTWVAARLKELGFSQALHIAGKPFCSFELWLSREALERLAKESWVKMVGMVSPPAVLF